MSRRSHVQHRRLRQPVAHIGTLPAAPLKTTSEQRIGGVTGRGFLPGVSGNPGGRPRSERPVLEKLFPNGGEKLYRHLDAQLQDKKTPAKLKTRIVFFLIERLHGRAQQRVEVEGGASLVELLAAATHAAGREA